MTEPRRIVFDTNTLISRLLLPRSIPARAVRLALAEDRVLASDATMIDLAGVLPRKFDPYVTVDARKEFLRLLGRVVDIVAVLHVVRACRDPKDDKFLELAVNGEAGVIVIGDIDLLALHTFRVVRILTPRDFLAERDVSG
jgi:putative PIN family toxin of toxin-antitoxin system